MIPREAQYSYIFAHRFEEALEANRREASLLDSLTGSLLIRRAFIHLARDQRREAEAAIEELLRAEPSSIYSYTVFGEFGAVERLLRPDQRSVAFDAVKDSYWWSEENLSAARYRYINTAVHEAALGRPEVARVYFDSLRMDSERSPPSELQDQLRLGAWIQLGLGNREEALTLARRMIAEATDSDCITGIHGWRNDWRKCTLLARVYAHFGEHEAAMDLLEILLPAPSWLTVHILRVDPIWDPLRDRPRFQALLEKYADDVEH
jgi:tetratricopeptide (TPR) repeat protein